MSAFTSTKNPEKHYLCDVILIQKLLDYEKINCMVVRNMRKGKKRDIKSFVYNKNTIV